MYALNVENVVKDYKELRALKGLSLQMQDGEFFGLLGPNGAGKSTLIKSIVGLCRLNSGSIRVFDHDVNSDYMQARSLIGYAPQEVNLDRFFSIRKILEYNAGYFGATRKEAKELVEKLLEQFGLAEKAKVQFYKLSGGMQKRLLVAKALVSKPKLLILDEPTAGVDVEQRHELWEYLRSLNADGTSILLTTHYIDEAEALCERIGVIDHGEIRELGTPKALIARYCDPAVAVTFQQEVNASLLASLKGFEWRVEGKTVHMQGARAGVMTEELLKVLVHTHDYVVEDMNMQTGDLEDVFLKIVGRAIHEDTQAA